MSHNVMKWHGRESNYIEVKIILNISTLVTYQQVILLKQTADRKHLNREYKEWITCK